MSINIRPYRMVPIIVVVLMIAMSLKPTISSLLRQLYREERIARQLYESGADDVELSEHRIITIDFDQQPATDAALELVGDCDRLESLSLDCSIVTDAGLAHLSRLTRLSALEINLEDSSVTRTGLEAFRTMRGLRHLEIKDAPTDLSCFENATDLETLWLTGERMVSWDESVSRQDDRLKAFRNAKLLKDVHLEGPAVTPAGLRALLPDKPELESLYLEGSFVTDSALEALQDLPKLTTLKITGPIGDDGLHSVGKLGSLQHLHVRRNYYGDGTPHITDTALQHLRGLSRLKDLHLSGTRIKGPGLAYVADLQQLTWLSLDGELTDEGLRYLTGPASLRSLGVGDSITRSGASELLERMPDVGFDHYGRIVQQFPKSAD